jgi:glycosyltransferase involved in cell wall biosynthesis
VTRVFFVDPSVRDFGGHFRTQLAGFAAMLAPEERYAVVNRNWSGGAMLGGAHVVPWFRWSLPDFQRVSPKGLATRSRDATRRHLRSLGVSSAFADPLAYCAKWLVWSGALLRAQACSLWRLGPGADVGHQSIYRPDLRRLVKEFRLGPSDHLVIPTTDHQILLAVLSVCANTSADDLPRFHLRFLCDDSCNIGGHPSPMSFEDMLRWLRTESLLMQRVFLYAETARLADWMECIAGVRPALAPYPVFTGARPPRATRRPTLRIGYLGQARYNKGFDRLAAILLRFEALYSEAASKGCNVPVISLVVHAAPGSEKLVRAFEEAAQTLQLDLELIDRTVDEEEYQQIIDRIDILLLPYKISRYRRKGSGIAQEALVNGIPFVCSSETALVDLLLEGNGESSRTDDEFASALLKIALNYDDYLNCAILAAAIHHRLHQDNPLRNNICGSDLVHSRGNIGGITGILERRARDATPASCSNGSASSRCSASRNVLPS